MLMGSNCWMDGGEQVPDATLCVTFTGDEPLSFDLEIALKKQVSKAALYSRGKKIWGNTAISLGSVGKLL